MSEVIQTQVEKLVDLIGRSVSSSFCGACFGTEHVQACKRGHVRVACCHNLKDLDVPCPACVSEDAIKEKIAAEKVAAQKAAQEAAARAARDKAAREEQAASKKEQE